MDFIYFSRYSFYDKTIFFIVFFCFVIKYSILFSYFLIVKYKTIVIIYNSLELLEKPTFFELMKKQNRNML